MAAILLTKLCIALIISSVLILVQFRSLFAHPVLFALFLAVFFIDNFLIVLTNYITNLQILPNTVWEGFLVCSWSGKLYSIFCMFILLYLIKKVLSKDEAGLTIRQNPGSVLPACVVTFLLATWAFGVGINSPKGRLDVLTLAYLAIVPGLNEELVYRGILLAILIKIIPGNLKIFGTQCWGAIFITSLLFGLLHGFWLDENLVFHVEALALRNAIVSGLIFAWLRAKSGSLVMPVIAHGLEDFLFFLPRML